MFDDCIWDTEKHSCFEPDPAPERTIHILKFIFVKQKNKLSLNEHKPMIKDIDIKILKACLHQDNNCNNKDIVLQIILNLITLHYK